MNNKEKLLVEIQSKFRKNIRGAGLIYMALYELVEEGRPITPEAISRAVYAPLSFVKEYEYIYSIYVNTKVTHK